jgi:DNA-binding response OmpR family regulator
VEKDSTTSQPEEPASVLLIDDDVELARLLRDYLTSHHAIFSHVTDGKAGLSRLAQGDIDVVLLDVMLPGDDGFEVCRKLRAIYTVPVVMLTARGNDDDRIVGLELGADDYLPKPFNPRELLARIRAVLRRARPRAAEPSVAADGAGERGSDKPADKLVIGALILLPAEMAVSLDGKPIPLTSFEFRVLHELAKRAGEPLPRADLASALTGERYDPSVDRSLDVHISHLRQKLEDDPREPRRIKTVRGVGYMLVRPQ